MANRFGYDLEEIDLSNCENEPIHLPGRIQPHGFLLALRPDDLTVSEASANLETFIGAGWRAALDAPIQDLLEPESAALLKKSATLNAPQAANPQELGFTSRDGESPRFNCQLHRSGDALVLECEPVYEMPTVNYRSFYNYLVLSINKFQRSKSLSELCQMITEQIQSLTGYDRVMVYKFDKNLNGEVIAETAQLHIQDSFLNLRYPSTDIPPQARELYLRNTLRIIPDINYEPVDLYRSPEESSEDPLDLSLSTLRSVSPIHVEYLSNMGVKATLVISLVINGKLWGLVACHHYEKKYLPYQIRKASEFISRVLAYNISLREQADSYERITQFKQKQAELLNYIYSATDVITGLTEHRLTLKDLIECDGAIVYINDALRLIGSGLPEDVALQLIAWLDEQPFDVYYETEHLKALFPAAAPYQKKVSGLLAIRLGADSSEYIIWLRGEFAHSIDWAGKPTKNVQDTESGPRLSPRKSFEKWQERVEGFARAWEAWEIEGAQSLQAHLAELRHATDLKNFNWELLKVQDRLDNKSGAAGDIEMELRNQRLTSAYEIEKEKNKLKSDIISTISHEIRTPLTAIMGFNNLLQRALDANPELAGYTDKIKFASQRLLSVLDAMLDLSKAEAQAADLALKPLEVVAFCKRALEMLEPMADEKGLKLSFESGKSQIELRTDQQLLFQILSNLLNNAVKYTDEGEVRLRVEEARTDGKTFVRFVVQDTGEGMDEAQIPELFKAFRQKDAANRKGGVGLGLSITKKFVEMLGGTIALSSPGDSGTTVTVSFPADLRSGGLEEADDDASGLEFVKAFQVEQTGSPATA